MRRTSLLNSSQSPCSAVPDSSSIQVELMYLRSNKQTHTHSLSTTSETWRKFK